MLSPVPGAQVAGLVVPSLGLFLQRRTGSWLPPFVIAAALQVSTMRLDPPPRVYLQRAWLENASLFRESGPENSERIVVAAECWLRTSAAAPQAGTDGTAAARWGRADRGEGGGPIAAVPKAPRAGAACRGTLARQ
jgi:hypothetical protein